VTTWDPADPRIYVRLAEDLRARISDGRLKPGNPVPSITVIVRETGYARHTVRHAMELLESEGLVTRYKGLGYYVTSS
jgi:DNA-binding GntR family transcriptional regulator